MTGSMPTPGWLYAEGDPPGTVRYWDGTAWQGEPRPGGQTPPPGTTPAMSAPPPMAPSPTAPPPTEPPKRMSGKAILGVVLGAFLLLGGCVGYFAIQASGQVGAGRSFLEALAAADYAAVEDSIDPSCFTDDELAQIEDNIGIFRGMEIIDVESNQISYNTGSDNSGTVVAEVRMPEGERLTVELGVVERNDWVVCGFNFD